MGKGLITPCFFSFSFFLFSLFLRGCFRSDSLKFIAVHYAARITMARTPTYKMMLMRPLNNIHKGREEETEDKKRPRYVPNSKATDDVCLEEQRRKIQSPEQQVWGRIMTEPEWSKKCKKAKRRDHQWHREKKRGQSMYRPKRGSSNENARGG